MSKTKKIVKSDGPAEGLVGERRTRYTRGEPVEVPASLADALMAQDGSGWKEVSPKASKKSKEES